jgi:two-component system probable response regulator PhcQ
METLYDYKRFTILYVDDEEKSLRYFARAFADKFTILTATSAEEGYRLLEANADQIGVIMSDQRMPGEKGVQFLQKARQLRPRIIRILATAFADLESAIDAVNSGAIYKYVTKPWEVAMIETTLKRSLEFFMVQRERDALLREKLSVLHNLVITDRVLSLGVLAAGMGNQLNNTMSAVRAFLDLTPDILRGDVMDLSQLRDPDFWERFHRKVQDRIRLIVELLGNLKPGSTTEPDISLHQAFQEATTSLSTELSARGIQVQNNIPTDLPLLPGQSAVLRKLGTLLLRNESTVIPNNSPITLAASVLAGESPSIELIVTDEGPGMPQEAILSLFNPFVLRDTPSQEFGLHLMACYFAVHHLGGSIEITDQTEKGLRTRIVLPIQPSKPEAGNDAESFLVSAMTNDRLWEKLLGGI